MGAVSEQFKPSPLVSVFDEVYDTYRRQTGGFGLRKNIVTLERAAQAASSESLTVFEARAHMGWPRSVQWLHSSACSAP